MIHGYLQSQPDPLHCRPRPPLLPLIPIFPLEINVISPPVPVSFSGDNGAKEPVHGADDQGAEDGGPEAVHFKPGDDAGGHLEEHGIDDKGKQPQGQDVDGEGEDDQDRPEKGVQHSQEATMIDPLNMIHLSRMPCMAFDCLSAGR